MQITLTIPDRVGRALRVKAAEFDMLHTEFLKSLLFAATQSPQGVVLKLDLEPLPKTEMPLFDASGVTLETEVPNQP